MVRIVLLLVIGAGIAGGVYYLTLPDCKKPGYVGDTAPVATAVPASAPVASSAKH